ncbi:hypothetical protein M409DRAFT_52650 [Zasmidium cellare ATCC 36951]|uniref:Cytochrome P450 n=1 Tax=Zasmidium cellare ATCC 36951 TaxID=1080233 RepID=A0A6A6CUA6_ZASCE|nr:uncharacterized protein M409DRAFT_52650 [Zasmidium cellare ATCC 36951]KAF2169402.1 hypothetical protein M409DRAFT_52650 [Zasmidium cellare ATCC 36951]
MRKDKFYRTISGDTDESIVSTRNRDEHARKRRQISNVFSHRNVLSMESLVAAKVQQLVERLDAAAASGEMIDIRQWLNYFTFDVISMMAFGNDPGFLRSGNAQAAAETTNGSKVYRVDPIMSFQDNTVHVATLGHWPALLRVTKPLTRWSMYSKRGDDFTNMCIHQVRRRLEKVSHPRNDFFQHLLTDSKGEKRCLPFGELVQEAGVLLSAGSDTTASAMTNTLYLWLRHPDVLEKLRTEIESALPDTKSAKHLVVLPHTPMRNVDYLRACLDEGLRHLPPTSIGLLRMTPPEGARIAGHWIRGGVTVSVPTYTIHHDTTLFSDPWTYRPERWLEGNAKERQNLKDYVIPFTLGRHACIGRNIAFLEQTVVLSTLVTRYAFEFTAQGFQLPVLERINANPGPLPVLILYRI